MLVRSLFSFTATGSAPRLWTLMLSLPLLASCYSKNPSYPEEMDTLVMDVSEDMQEKTDAFEVYQINPGDKLDVFYYFPVGGEDSRFTIAVDHKLEVSFLNAPELNQSQSVRPDGMISMPYIGQVKASGMTVGELTAFLENRYASILKEPQLNIVVSEFRDRINTFREDLRSSAYGISRKISVRPDGVTTFPYLGEVSVVGRTITQVNQEINQLYDAFMPGLRVDLSLDKYEGSLVYVLGEVEKPGAYTLIRPITALEALTLAGGYKSSAKLEHIVALRRTENQVQAKRIDLVKALALEDPQYFLKPDDVLFVPKTTLYATSEIADQIRSILLSRGWSLNFGWDVPIGGN